MSWFGCNTIGANKESIEDVIRGSLFPLSEDAETLDSITVHLESIKTDGSNLHPDGSPLPQELTAYPALGVGETYHDRIDDDPPDDGASYLTTSATVYKQARFLIEDFALPAGKGISNVTVYARMSSGFISPASRGRAYIGVYISNLYEGSQKRPPLSWTTFSSSWTKNPSTGNDWTDAEIDSLQINIRMKTEAGMYPISVTAMWVVVEYADATIKVKCAVYYLYSDPYWMPMDSTEERTFDQHLSGWETFSFPAPKVSASAGSYILVGWSDSGVNMRYATGDANQGRYLSQAYNSFPVLVIFNTNNHKNSIYCTYTPTAVPKAGLNVAQVLAILND